MEVLKVKELGLEAIQKKLDKAAFDEVELNPRIREKNKELYGEDLTANQIVERIVNEVRHNGDEAVIKYTKLLDGADFTPSQFLVTQEEYDKSWSLYKDNGVIMGQMVRPIERVALYVPGGTAAYPSSVVMNVMPAKVAGVKEIIMMAPPSRDGKLNPYVLIAAKEAGVDAIYKVGGAQAIAAMAFGTETIPKVDKITGPGNIFVTLAKKAVYGHCDIDMLAGPSEILIVADKTADPVYTAADMLSQAEHDMLASSIVLTDDEALADKVLAEVEKQLAKLPRKEIAKASLERNGRIILTENLMQAMELANYSAPEHMEILTENPFSLLPYVRHAGAVFLGAYSPEPLGDYFAGPNHVLPTGGTARYYSVLNTETFMKRTSIISYTQKALQEVSSDIVRLAEAEGLQAHANAIKLRGEKID